MAFSPRFSRLNTGNATSCWSEPRKVEAWG